MSSSAQIVLFARRVFVDIQESLRVVVFVPEAAGDDAEARTGHDDDDEPPGWEGEDEEDDEKVHAHADDDGQPSASLCQEPAEGDQLEEERPTNSPDGGQ